MDLTGIKKTAFSLTHSAYEWLKSKLKQIVKAFKEPSDAMRCFYILTIVAICCFAYTWLNNGFTVPLSGDYSLQEMTFLKIKKSPPTRSNSALTSPIHPLAKPKNSSTTYGLIPREEERD